jgi:hypothetical protein
MRQQRRLPQEQRTVTAAATTAAESRELHAAATVNDADEQ